MARASREPVLLSFYGDAEFSRFWLAVPRVGDVLSPRVPPGRFLVEEVGPAVDRPSDVATVDVKVSLIQNPAGGDTRTPRADGGYHRSAKKEKRK